MISRFILRLIAILLATYTIVVLSRDLTAPQPEPNQGPSDVPAKPNRLTQTPVEHFIVLMQENHTFDNYFGTYPGADGLPNGTCMPAASVDPNTPHCVAPFHLDSVVSIDEDDDSPEIGPTDLDHSSATFQAQYNNGRMDGFVTALQQRNQDGRVALGYYDERDLPAYWSLAREYVLFDRFFSSVSGGSFLNHVFWIAGASGGNKEGSTNSPLNDLPTIFDRLDERGISWKFYIQNYDPNLTYRTASRYVGNRASQVVWAPLLRLDRYIDDPRLNSHIVDLEQYYTDLEAGTLPAVAYLVPSGNSEHPPGRVSAGQHFVVSLLQALLRSDAWPSSAFLLTYDDWGGWYDHVPPPQVDAYDYGFRVPALLVSPYARRGHVEHAVLDFTSILRFIEDNWGLKPLAERDSFATSIVGAFDFSAPPRSPRFVLPLPAAERPMAPVRGLIYATYGGAFAFAVLLVAWAALGARPRHRVAEPAPTDIAYPTEPWLGAPERTTP
jgi:phospholipase C